MLTFITMHSHTRARALTGAKVWRIMEIIIIAKLRGRKRNIKIEQGRCERRKNVQRGKG